MSEDISAKKKVIASYGDVQLIRQNSGDVRLNPRMVLQSDSSITRIYGHGIDDDVAVSDLYNSLHNTFVVIVKYIEGG